MENVEELVKAALQNADAGVSYTVHGERPMKYDQGKPVPQKYPVEELGKLHRRFSDFHHDIIATIYSAMNDIIRLKRSIPLTRNELLRPARRRGITEKGVSKRTVNDLIKFGLIQERIIKIINSAGKPVRAQAIIYLTPRGRAYVRERIDEEYTPDLPGGG